LAQPSLVRTLLPRCGAFRRAIAAFFGSRAALSAEPK
jgi:hypothetical protein